MSELKPCPFCGGEAKLVNTWNCLCQIICRSCGATIGEVKKHPNDFRTRDEVIAAWNRRAIDRDELLEVAESLEKPWPDDKWYPDTLLREEVQLFEGEMAQLIRKAVGA